MWLASLSVVLLLFLLSAEAEKAIKALNGRYFGGRVVTAEVYDEEKFEANDLTHWCTRRAVAARLVSYRSLHIYSHPSSISYMYVTLYLPTYVRVRTGTCTWSHAWAEENGAKSISIHFRNDSRCLSMIGSSGFDLLPEERAVRLCTIVESVSNVGSVQVGVRASQRKRLVLPSTVDW